MKAAGIALSLGALLLSAPPVLAQAEPSSHFAALDGIRHELLLASLKKNQLL